MINFVDINRIVRSPVAEGKGFGATKIGTINKQTANAALEVKNDKILRPMNEHNSAREWYTFVNIFCEGIVRPRISRYSCARNFVIMLVPIHYVDLSSFVSYLG